MQRVKIPQLQCEQNPGREGTADASRKCRQYAVDSQRKRSEEVMNSWKFAVEIQLMFFDATIGSKNYTICKINVSVTDIFQTD